jgi:dienelactone hydrolase
MRRPILALLLGALLLAGCSSSRSAPTSTDPTLGSTPASTSTTVTPPSRAVVTEHLDLVDPSRPVVSGGVQRSASRSLPTTVVRPAGPGRHPLVLVLPGYGVGPSTYARMMAWLARHDVVAAAPSFPLADPSQGLGLDRSDLPNEATDVSFVIDQLERGPTAGSIDPDRLMVLGHSDGADVALELGYDPNLRDPRMGSIIAVAPDPIAGPVISGGPRLLLIHGSSDEVVDPSSSASVFARLSAERWSLTILGADHASAIVGPSPWTPTFDAAVAAFLVPLAAGHRRLHVTEVLRALPGTEVEVGAGP